MKKIVLPLIISALMMSSCSLFDRYRNSSSSNSSSNNGSSGASSEVTSSSGNNSSSHTSSSENSSQSSSGSSEPDDPVPPAGDGVEEVVVSSIAEAKAWILAHQPSLNVSDCGVDLTHKITIKGYALNKFSLEKTTSKYGLDISGCGKVVMGDATGYLVCASANSSSGTCLYGKVGSYAGKDTSRYTVTGYPSIYLGHPELSVPNSSFTFNSSLDVSKDINSYITDTITINEFYSLVKDINYNCAGHGYGDYYKLAGLTCLGTDCEDDYAVMTDGSKVMKVILDNGINMSKGEVVDIVGYLSTKKHQPALRLLEKRTSESPASTYDYEHYATEMSAASLWSHKTSQDDVAKTYRYDDYISLFGDVYTAEVYLDKVVENSKYYVTFNDNYQSSQLTGKDDSGIKGNIFVENDNFWNCTQSELDIFNGYGKAGKIHANERVRVYYVLTQTRYKSNKPIWNVLLVPDSIPAV